MFSKSPLKLAVAALIAAPLGAHAEIELSAVLKNETAVYLKSDQVTGQARTTLDNSENDAGDLMKFENSARIFINGDLGESSSWHAELRPVVDFAGETPDYKYHRNYTQNDYLRELYMDTEVGNWDLRIGKQQVVWGTADGIKLLDIINPTDFRELNQNAFEDSRIPVWMINAEHNFERGNLQLIVSQAETNKVAGLWTQEDGSARATTTHAAGTNTYTFVDNSQINGQDNGHPFIMQGVDVITGGVNGFFNIGSAFAGVTNTFSQGGFIDPSLNGFAEFTTVDGFVTPTYANCANPAGGPGMFSGEACLEFFTELTNADVTNLIDGAKDPTGTSPLALPNGTFVDPAGGNWNVANPNSAWEHFPNATFATFNAYVGMTTEYRRDYDDDFLPSEANLGGRFRSYLDNGLNYSVNYFYGYDANPHVNIHWEDPTSGKRLAVRQYDTGFDTVSGPGPAAPGDRDILVFQIEDPDDPTIQYGSNASAFVAGANPVAPGEGGPAKLVFVEDRNRIHNLGGSFDYATEAGDIPLVIRGEFLYQKDVMQPVVDRGALADGNLVGALRSEEHDFFKYVIGVDATVLTNLLISGQFIQFRNLDFIDRGCSFTTQGGNAASCAEYTGDPATMNVTNGLRKGYENKEFYSLFLSKPFGPNQLGRINNIIIYEEGGGYWDRLDAEYSLSDQLVVTGEINLYWGDQETLFGQFENSSNVQVGLKYIIE
jgi:hypothetical protein